MTPSTPASHAEQPFKPGHASWACPFTRKVFFACDLKAYIVSTGKAQAYIDSTSQHDVERPVATPRYSA